MILIVYKSFDIKTSVGRVTNENIFNKEFVNELLKFNKNKYIHLL